MDGRMDERTDGNLHAFVFLQKQVRQKPVIQAIHSTVNELYDKFYI